MENVIVVDNLPVVPPEKVEKLAGSSPTCLSYDVSAVFARWTTRTVDQSWFRGCSGDWIQGSSSKFPDENNKPICFFSDVKLTTLSA